MVRAAVSETTALGAALLAGLAEGVWGSLDDIASVLAHDAAVEPAADRSGADAAYRGWLRAVERTRHWAPTAAGLNG